MVSPRTTLDARHVHADQIAEDAVVLHHRPPGGFDELDARVHRLVRAAVELCIEPAHRGVVPAYGHHAARAAGVDHRLAAALERDRPLQNDRALMDARREAEHCAGLRFGDGAGERARRRHHRLARDGRRGERGGHEDSEEVAQVAHPHTAFGSTNIVYISGVPPQRPILSQRLGTFRMATHPRSL